MFLFSEQKIDLECHESPSDVLMEDYKKPPPPFDYFDEESSFSPFDDNDKENVHPGEDLGFCSFWGGGE